jgi:hypothetical protein
VGALSLRGAGPLLYRYLTTVSQGGNADIDKPASARADP